MTTRIQMIDSFYNEIDEDLRLNNSRHGQLEYLTTMACIHRYAPPARSCWRSVRARAVTPSRWPKKVTR